MHQDIHSRLLRVCHATVDLLRSCRISVTNSKGGYAPNIMTGMLDEPFPRDFFCESACLLRKRVYGLNQTPTVVLMNDYRDYRSNPQEGHARSKDAYRYGA